MKVDLRLESKQIWSGQKSLGPDTALIVEHNELTGLGVEQGVIHATLPNHIDMVFAAGQNLVVVESKRLGDFLSSWFKSRLSRQITTLIDTGHRPLLLLRWTTVPSLDPPAKAWQTTWWSDIVRYQQLGVTVAFGPYLDAEVPSVIDGFRKPLAGGRNPLAAIERTDQRRSEPGHNGWFLKNIKGIGPVTAMHLHARFGSTRAALTASNELWRNENISPAVIANRAAALK